MGKSPDPKRSRNDWQGGLMCGIAGIIGGEMPAGGLERMREAMAHRGPDGSGIYIDENGAAGVAHTRLAILDLSERAAQPMKSADGRYAIVFNGEIYNYRELRNHLEKAGEPFQTGGDTELLLRMYMRQGAAGIERLRGMFAFAIWDSVEKSAVLARDVFGIKPLYWAQSSGSLIFASEVRAMLASGLVPRDWDAQGLYNFFLHGHTREPLTVLKGVRMLEAGRIAEWKNGQLCTMHQLEWPESEPQSGGSIEELGRSLADSVRAHFVSDVPVGLFLSGGLDSTAVLALARREMGTGLQTFSIGFPEKEWDESPLAERTAKHFETDHQTLTLDARMAGRFLSDFLAAQDHPSIDGLNTYCISRLAREAGARVVLSGLGGDELFGGYPSFQKIPKMMDWGWNLSALGPLRPFGAKRLESFLGNSKYQRLMEYVGGDLTLGEAYRAMRGLFLRREARRLVDRITGVCLDDPEERAVPQMATPEMISHLELTLYMRSQLLRDSDANSMAHGLELRVPLVDKEVLRSVSALPPDFRFQPQKGALVQAVPEIPEWIRDHKKQGFAFPFDQWFKGDWNQIRRAIQKKYRSRARLDTWSRVFALHIIEEWGRRLE